MRIHGKLKVWWNYYTHDALIHNLLLMGGFINGGIAIFAISGLLFGYPSNMLYWWPMFALGQVVYISSTIIRYGWDRSRNNSVRRCSFCGEMTEDHFAIVGGQLWRNPDPNAYYPSYLPPEVYMHPACAVSALTIAAAIAAKRVGLSYNEVLVRLMADMAES